MQATAEDVSSDTTAMLRESALDFVTRSTNTKALRERRQTLPGHDPALVRQMADLGWFGILVPEEDGGLSLGLPEMAVVLEELGKGLLADPLLGAAVLAGRVIARAAPSALRQTLLAGLVDASALPALAWQEGMGSLDVSAIATTARTVDGGAQLNGGKRFVAGAAGAAGFVVSALAADGLGLYWVPSDAPGLALTHEWRADGTPAGVLTLNAVNVSAAQVIAAPGAVAQETLAHAIDEGAVLAGAEMMGVIEAALAMSLAYMRTRVQFGKPIGSFQALQHKTADLYVQQELTRAVLAEALGVLAQEPDSQQRALMASRFKARSSDAGLRVTREVIQLHGAIGFTDEHDAGLYLKRALVLAAWLGNSSAHRRRFAGLARETLAL